MRGPALLPGNCHGGELAVALQFRAVCRRTVHQSRTLVGGSHIGNIRKLFLGRRVMLVVVDFPSVFDHSASLLSKLAFPVFLRAHKYHALSKPQHETKIFQNF